MTQRVVIPEVQLRSWRATGYPYKLIAAAIAEWATGQERGTVLPDDAEFGRDFDRVAGPKPFLRAKHLLVAQGVLEMDDGPFYVALPDREWIPASASRTTGRTLPDAALACDGGSNDR
jgi:hypothetical protein